MQGAKILYLTLDGVLEPLGFSQVARVVVELAGRGFRYELLSAERESDLAKRDHVEHVERFFRDAGVDWIKVPRSVTNGSLRTSGAVLARMAGAIGRAALGRRVGLVHARSVQPAALAYALRATQGTPYLFDARGCWIDERSGVGDWFFHAGPYAAGKLVEHRLFHAAAGVVTLTALQANDVAASFCAPPPLVAIPTCADYRAFELRAGRPDKPRESRAVPPALQQILRGKLVVGLVGSLNRYYRTEDALRLATELARASPEVHLLVLTAQRDEHARLLNAVGFPMDRVTLTRASHEEMPEWLQWIDWSLMLLDDTAAKRGSMPTKLAEFFASGVRTVAYGCNSEMTSWVRRAGSGHVLDALDRASLDEAVRVVTTSRVDRATLRRAREVTEPHFGLASGVDRYAALLEELLPRA